MVRVVKEISLNPMTAKYDSQLDESDSMHKGGEGE
jgi:hypothetical protein